MNKRPNELIMASAGSGKTFRLTDRYVKLLLEGEEPESIVALTFSRKAAGEFFDAILEKLVEAVDDEAKRTELNKRLRVEADAGTYREKMRRLLRAMNRLRLSTLDSFFHSVLSRFAPERGLGGGFELLSESEVAAALRRARESLFREGELDREFGRHLGAAFRAGGEGGNDRSVAGWVDGLAKAYGVLRTLCPEAARWGGKEEVWPDGTVWEEADEGEEPFRADLDECRRLAGEAGMSEPAFSDADLEKWENALGLLAEWRPGKSLPKSPVTLPRAFRAGAEWREGDAEMLRKPSGDCFTLAEELARPLARVVRSILRREFELRMKRARGAYAALTGYEKVYDRKVRRKGKLTFSDLPLLLGEAQGLDRELMEYRLDGAHRHWMLDEFQDTSPIQWAVLESLVDEVITDDERLFFCVGDVKQAIYGWRGGDSRLFGLLEKQYEGRLKPDKMAVSWRSGPAVLDTVNAVFGSSSLAAQANPRWATAWATHEPSGKTENLAGHAAWWTSPDEEARLEAIVSLLRRTDPVGRGISCAVLTRKRETGRELTDYLRRELPDLPVTNEVGSKPCEDNGFTMALLSLLKAAAHPRDGFSLGHLKMTPLRELLAPGDSEEEWREALAGVLRRVCEEGFESVIHSVGKQALERVLPEARDFARNRLESLRDAARRYDEGGDRDVDAFIDYALHAEAAAAGAEGSVRVMTIHRSKGLTFDMVILPEVASGSLDQVRRNNDAPLDLHVEREADGKGVAWILDWPSRAIAEGDERLGQVLQTKKSNAAFENLCNLYVAMTRPRCGLYLFTAPLPKSSKTVNYLTLLNDTLGGEEAEGGEKVGALTGDAEVELRYSHGEPDWFEDRARGRDEADAAGPDVAPSPLAPPSLTEEGVATRPSPRSVNPSAGKVFSVTGRTLFGENRRRALELGDCVHKLFEDLGWLTEEVAPDSFSASLDEAPEEAREHFLRCMETEETRAVFLKPEGEVELWREKKFCVMREDGMLSGTFDRVVLRRDESGNCSEAEIIDFKTDREVEKEEDVAAAVERHRPQMELYREALSRLTGLEAGRIACRLLFSRSARLGEA